MRLLDHEIALIELIRNEIDKAEKVEHKLDLIGKLVEFQKKLLDFEQATEALSVQDAKNRDDYRVEKAKIDNRV
ncbi:hypothetical protein [Acinetobacter thermotolerans]|uniref:hypothetical protein n=1 Tax=Acinetobacter thermotolerans TaxID=3151487 RepID=UPI00325A99ED